VLGSFSSIRQTDRHTEGQIDIHTNIVIVTETDRYRVRRERRENTERRKQRGESRGEKVEYVSEARYIPHLAGCPDIMFLSEKARRERRHQREESRERTGEKAEGRQKKGDQY
jgi:hypothetical protein